MLKYSLRNVIDLLNLLGSHKALKGYFYGNDLEFMQQMDELKPPIGWGKVSENIRFLNTDTRPKRGQKAGVLFHKSYEANFAVLVPTESDNSTAKQDIEAFADIVTDEMVYILVNQKGKIPEGLAVTFQGKTILQYNTNSIGFAGVELQMSIVHPVTCDSDTSFLSNIADRCSVIASFTYTSDGTEAILTNASSNHEGTPTFKYRYHRSQEWTEVEAETTTIQLPRPERQYIEVEMTVRGTGCTATTKAAIFQSDFAVVGKSYGNQLIALGGDFDSRDFDFRDFLTELN